MRTVNFADALRTLPPQTQKLIKQIMQSAKIQQVTPYYSTLSYIAVKTGVAPDYTYTLERAERTAFRYAVDGARDSAGAPGENATLAETNVQNAGTTNNNETVTIHGISATPLPGSDPELFAQVVRNSSSILKIGIGAELELGRMEMLASPWGLYGVGESTVKPGALLESAGRAIQFLSNGMPVPGQYLKIDPIKWQGSSVAGSDTQLNFKTQLQRQIVIAGHDRAAVAGSVEGFTAPASIRCDILVALHCKRIGYRSTNA
jgi:hypothetical protein